MAQPRTRSDEQLQDIPRSRSWVLPALLRLQRALGYLSDESIELVARHVRLSVSDVDSIASGYPELRRTPLEGVPVKVCLGLGCALAGAESLRSTLAKDVGELGIDLEVTSCLFVCALAPVVEIQEACLGRATIDTVHERITDVRDSTPSDIQAHAGG